MTKQIDELMALATEYARAMAYDGATHIHRDKLRTALEAALKPGGEPVARLHITETDEWPDVEVEVLDGTYLQPSMSPVNVYISPQAQPDALKPHGEPVAWIIDWPNEPDLGHYFSEEKTDAGRCRPLYTAPPAQTPVAEVTRAAGVCCHTEVKELFHSHVNPLKVGEKLYRAPPAQTPPPRLTAKEITDCYIQADGEYHNEPFATWREVVDRAIETAVRKQAGWE